MQQKYCNFCFITVFIYGKGIILCNAEKGLLVVLMECNQLEFWQISEFLTVTYSIPQCLQLEEHFITMSTQFSIVTFPFYNHYIIVPMAHFFTSYNELTYCLISLLQGLAI
jgi:hypothetical protein